MSSQIKSSDFRNRKSPGNLPSALDSVEEIVQRAGNRRLAVFLDYDGTLTPIVERPELATLSAGMRSTLQELSRVAILAVVSGRDLEDVRRLVGIEGIYFAGSHGFDILGPRREKLEKCEAADFVSVLDDAERWLGEQLAPIEGILIERKKFSIAVHYRRVAAGKVREVEKRVDEVIRNTHGLKKSYGKKVFEIQPEIDWHKGKAVNWLLKTLGFSPNEVLPLYIGDDVTDEDAFDELFDRGIGIFVEGEGGPRETSARYALRNVEEVQEFLELLTAAWSSST